MAFAIVVRSIAVTVGINDMSSFTQCPCVVQATAGTSLWPAPSHRPGVEGSVSVFGTWCPACCCRSLSACSCSFICSALAFHRFSHHVLQRCWYCSASASAACCCGGGSSTFIACNVGTASGLTPPVAVGSLSQAVKGAMRWPDMALSNGMCSAPGAHSIL